MAKLESKLPETLKENIDLITTEIIKRLPHPHAQVWANAISRDPKGPAAKLIECFAQITLDQNKAINQLIKDVEHIQRGVQ